MPRFQLRADRVRFIPNILVPLLMLLLSVPLMASGPIEPIASPKRPATAWHALVNATVIPAPGERIENATIVFRNGVITSIAPDAPPPQGATVHDCTGLLIAPAFIDAFVEVQTPDLGAAQDRHWSVTVQPERSALLGPGLTESQRKRLHADGFAVAHIVPRGAVFAGRSATVLTSESSEFHHPIPSVLPAPPFHTITFTVSSWGERRFPGSKMGAIALIRQTLSDADWYRDASWSDRQSDAAGEPVRRNASLEALADKGKLLFATDNVLDTLRSAKLAAKSERQAVYIGSGEEYKRLSAIADIDPTLIVPLRFPTMPEINTPGERNAVNFRDLMSWEQAPTNLRRLNSAGVTTAITSSRIPSGQSFFENLRLTIACGLSEDDALAMLTITPAQILALDHRIGRIAPGYLANMQVIEGDSLFAEDRKLRSLWIAGVEHKLDPAQRYDFEAKWEGKLPIGDGVDVTITIGPGSRLTITRTPDEPAEDDADPKKPQTIPTSRVSITDNRLSFMLDLSSFDIHGRVFASAILEGDDLYARLELPDGGNLDWTARRLPSEEATEDQEGKPEDKKPSTRERILLARAADIPDELHLPFGPFGLAALPEQEHLILTNATVWTSGPDGILTDAEIEIRDGKIAYVGAARATHDPDARVIHFEGKHITPGLIDCHSHTGISGGVNEGTFSSTAMVRIEDVIDPDAMNWYRQLAGGLTAASQLHGSANAIGGQNSVVKLRWGVAHPDQMRLEGAPPGIKFALGENVKQSNWGDTATTRYPQTRMGVETFIVDRFLAAQQYAAERADPEKNRRRDLELEALAEILDGRRLIHCHSYRQDEILMLCRVAERFGFTIGTFQHVLEGYKVAEHIVQHSLGGSAFSDWWAYKFEVFDAIPENGAIMHDVGVIVSYNSDSDEMARRMNIEAAKAVKYGGIEPDEALKFVTLNPAIQLGIEHRVGSLEVGKDADIAVWSGNPLSTLSRCEMTIVDGRILFSLEMDARLRSHADAERRRIIQKILALEDAPRESPPADGDVQPEYDGDDPPDEPDLRSGGQIDFAHMRIGGCSHGCESCSEPLPIHLLEIEYIWMLTNGIDPRRTRPGQCGCGEGAAFIYSY